MVVTVFGIRYLSIAGTVSIRLDEREMRLAQVVEGGAMELHPKNEGTVGRDGVR